MEGGLELREWLKNIRENKNISQKELAAQINITYQFYNYIENGGRRPSPETAKAIAEALGFETYGLNWTKFYDEGKTSCVNFADKKSNQDIFQPTLADHTYS